MRQLLRRPPLLPNNRQQALGTSPGAALHRAPARVVIADAAFGAAIEHLQLPRTRPGALSAGDAPGDGPSRAPREAMPRRWAWWPSRCCTAGAHRRRVPERPLVTRGAAASARRRGPSALGVFSRWLRRALHLDPDGFDSRTPPRLPSRSAREQSAVRDRHRRARGLVDGHAQAVPLPAFAQPAEPARSRPDEESRDARAPAAIGLVTDIEVVEPASRILGMRPAGLRCSWWCCCCRRASSDGIGRARARTVEGEASWCHVRPDARSDRGWIRAGVTPLTLTLAAGTHVVEVRTEVAAARIRW